MEPGSTAGMAGTERVLAELARLAASRQEYGDLVQASLDLIAEAFAAPLLSLSVLESGTPAHYARVHGKPNHDWVTGSGDIIAGIHEEYLLGGVPPVARTWCRSFPARLRSSRSSCLTAAAPDRLEVNGDQEILLQRLSEQTLLVLDHALLLQQLEGLETRDRLTGIANQRQLVDVLDYEIRRHRYLGRHLALVVLDVEGLDKINRSFGRKYGNHILQKLAGLIRESVRPIDVVGRYEADEFAVVLPETDADGAISCAQLLTERLATVEFAGGEIGVTAGSAHAKPGDSPTPDELLQRAERSLHEAKRQQRNWSNRRPVTGARVR